MPPRDLVRTLLPFVAVVAAGLFAWWGAWNGQFLFDDAAAIVQNAPLRAGDWWQAAFGPTHHPLSNRPLACASIALDFAVFGPGPFGPRLTNVLLHLLNGALLLAVARRALLAPNLAARFTPGGATALATAIAAIWVAHALGGDSVCYATQRSTLLFSALLLVCFYATLRAHGSRRRLGWQVVAVAAMALGMASKEDLVVGPPLVVLFERAFVLPSWAALRGRLGFHLAMAATWAVLAACVAAGPPNLTVGYVTVPKLSAFEWLLTQAGVVAHYVRLALWPSPLRGAYDWGFVRSLGPAVLPGLLVMALLAAAVIAWRARPWLAFLGALFFLLLAPTSTVMPIVTEVVAERRVYLPMLFVLVPVVVAARALLARAPAAVPFLATALAVVALGLVAQQRVAVHATEPAFWQDAYDKRDPGSRSKLAAQILSNHALMLTRTGRGDEAHAIFDLAMQCELQTPVERMHHAVSLQQRGRHAEAIAALERVIREVPGGVVLAQAHAALGTCLLQELDKVAAPAADPRLRRAEEELVLALRLEPGNSASWNSLGYALSRRGDWTEAERAYQRATELSMEYTQPFLNRADALAHLGRTAEIQPMIDRLLAARPRDVALRQQLVQGALARGNVDLAKVLLRDLLRIDPHNQQAAAKLRELEGTPGR